jgi:hypothetical protein
MPDDKLEAQLETWAIVEVMGHQVYAGFVRQVSVGGAAMIRVDVPELPPREEKYESYDDAGKLVYKKRIIPGVPAFTKLLGVSSIFAITPCSKEAAEAAIERFRARPMNVVDVPGQRSLPLYDQDEQ